MPAKNDSEKLNDIIFEGILYFGIPASILLGGATFFMRRRARNLVATTAEHAVLNVLLYYGAVSVGFGLGMGLYSPFMEKKILERIPYSDVAAAIREGRRQ